MINVTSLVDELNQQHNAGLSLSEDGQAIYATKNSVINVLSILKEKYKYKMMIDITAVDLQGTFEVVYHVMNMESAHILRIKVSIPGDKPSIGTATGVWAAADVMEREVFDLMGIVFEGHKYLKRILCTDDFVGHPLRKDFKLNVVDRFNDFDS